MDIEVSYKQYNLPSWAPPSYLFGIIWPILYFFIFIALILSIQYPIIFIFIILNLLFNFMFIPIQKLQDQTFTFISVLLTFITALIVLIISYQYSLSIFLLFIPYCLWLGFATLLQYNIKLLNP